MTKNYFSFSLAVLLAHFSATATAAEIFQLTERCETAVALSALPDHLQDQASAWVLGDTGFEQIREGAGPFHCFVDRNHEFGLIPQCLDEPGVRAIEPRFLMSGRLIRSDMSYGAIATEIREASEKGEFEAADRPGLVYMMSPFNYIFVGGEQGMLHVPPHVMFHAPFVEPDAVGNSIDQALANTGLPFVQPNGVHGYMISFVENGSSAGSVETACEGRLPPAPDSVNSAAD